MGKSAARSAIGIVQNAGGIGNPYRNMSNGQFASSPIKVYRGVGFLKGELPANIENRVESVLQGGYDPELTEEVRRELTKDHPAGGKWWALKDYAADLFGRQVRNRDKSDYQFRMVGEWDEAGHVQPESVDPKYRRLNPDSPPVKIEKIEVRRTPSGSWVIPNDDGWITLGFDERKENAAAALRSRGR